VRDVPILSDNYYHIYNRGNLKQTLFHEKTDYIRFLFLLIHLQSPVVLTHTTRYIRNYLDKGTFAVREKDVADIHESKFVEIINFCIMPNHFHITLRAVTDDGVSRYMHRVSNAYAKYFNTKYKKTGHVFQGAYKAKFITSDSQLTYLSAYIHRNPNEMKKWERRCAEYPWSSYQDYGINRWGSLLSRDMVTATFKSFEDYTKFVETSGAKEDWESVYE
jgi:putative transposase